MVLTIRPFVSPIEPVLQQGGELLCVPDGPAHDTGGSDKEGF